MNRTDIEIYLDMIEKGVPAARLQDLAGRVGKTADEIRALHDGSGNLADPAGNAEPRFQGSRQ